MYANCMLDEKDFQRKADAAFEDLKRRMLTAGDEHGFDVEGESGKLEVLFEEPEEAKFVISPTRPSARYGSPRFPLASNLAGTNRATLSSTKNLVKIYTRS
jgi:frataxin-like iron-binding protein CyaY